MLEDAPDIVAKKKQKVGRSSRGKEDSAVLQAGVATAMSKSWLLSGPSCYLTVPSRYLTVIDDLS